MEIGRARHGGPVCARGRLVSDALEVFRRLLALVPLLGDEQPHALDDVAARVGTDADTVLHELMALGDRPDDPAGFVAGLTVEVEAAPQMRVRARSPHLKRPMRLTWSERQALDLGLAALALERPLQEHGAIARARAKLSRLSMQAPRADLADDRRKLAAYKASDPAVLRLLQQAARERRVVRLRYQGGNASAAVARTVRPYAVILAKGSWYCPAWCEAAGALRIFRLDRIEDAALDGATFERPDNFDPRALVRDGRVFQHDGAPTMTVRYSPRIARWIAEREGRVPDADGSLTLEHPLADPEWGIRHVLQYGPDAEVLAPATMRAALAKRLRALTARAR